MVPAGLVQTKISEAELDIGMRHARQFIEQYGAELLNLDLLQ